jgi:hypothetical protein
VHLAGGHHLDGIYLDAHIGAVPAPLLQLARHVIPTLPRVRAIMFEAVPESVSDLGADGLATVLDGLRELGRLPAAAALDDARPQAAHRGAPINATGAARREAQLLEYTTRASADYPDDDPGAAVLRHLTDHARLSLLVAEHGAQLRELLLTHGRERGGEILRDFLASTPASAWPAEQNAAFATWWGRTDHPSEP